MRLIDSIVQCSAELQTLRRDLHAHPELRFEEHRTADVIARQLMAWGIEVHRGLGGTGVVGTLRGGTCARAIGLRADMDALPIQEANTFAHASVYPGRMHACGHDGHCAMLLGAAQYLAQHRTFDGTVHFIFQPAEEGGAGAQQMIQAGLFQTFPCDAVFGMHNWPGLDVGQFGVRAGPLMASSNQFEITIQGKGAHAAMPHLGVDPVLIAAQLVTALQGIVTRNLNPIDNAVLSVTILRAGDVTNVVPDSATVSGTVRTFRAPVTDVIERRLRQLATLTAQAHDAQAQVSFVREYPPLVNHEAHTQFAARVLDDIVGPSQVVRDVEPTLGAEDFAFMLQERPGCYVLIGNGEGAHRSAGHGLGPCMLHNPSYDFNDALLPLGATYWVRLVEQFFSPTKELS